MTIMIPKSLLRSFDRDHLRLLETTCKAEETSADFFLTTPLSGCNTTRRQTPSAIVYSNTVLEIPEAAEDVVTRVRELEIQFSCFYSKYGAPWCHRLVGSQVTENLCSVMREKEILQFL